MSDKSHAEHRQSVVGAAQEWIADRDDEVGGGVITAWVMVVEVMAPDGRRVLARISGNGIGTSELTSWQRRGMLAEAAETWADGA